MLWSWCIYLLVGCVGGLALVCFFGLIWVLSPMFFIWTIHFAPQPFCNAHSLLTPKKEARKGNLYGCTVLYCTVQLVTTLSQTGLGFVNENSSIFGGLTIMKNCGSLPASPCFAIGPWEKFGNEYQYFTLETM